MSATIPYTGGCLCGALRYEARDEPVAGSHCQCRDCQKRSGTGHGSYLTFPDRSRVDIAGPAAHWSTAADSGNEKTHGFCPVCGCPVYLTFAAMPDIIVFHAASLDDPEHFTPQMLLYTSRGHRWDTTDPSLPAFETMPPPDTA